WPDNKNPSPYEILQTTPSEFSSRKLKITYYKLARLYHPDSNSHGHICSSNGALLSDKTKAERFKMVVSAYDILRDPKKKVIFDRFGIGWTGVDVTSGYSSAQPSQASHAVYRNHQSDEAFWNAGTWEDYQEHKRRSDSGAFKEQCDNTRWTYLSYVVGGMCVAAFIQIMAILDRTEAHYRYPTGSTVKSLYDLDLVLLNYGWGFAKMDRISRFLAHRDSS
ncbi:DnaJ-domain-containing protein, partial [Nadsonia fulvescens var. elongata DSM 6958]